MYQARRYREEMNAERFRFFRSVHRESDLYIGVPQGSYLGDMEGLSLQVQEQLYSALLDHAARHPAFLKSMEPLSWHESVASGILLPSGTPVEKALADLYACGEITGTGPMSAVAGLFAREVGEALEQAFAPEEVLVENGGDLYLRNREDLLSAVHAGDSPLSDRLGLLIPPGCWGICTSSGTLGHSFSRGRADSLTIVARSAPLADAWATSLANRVAGPGDIEEVMELSALHPEILSCLVIVGDRMGIRGEIELRALS